jgi:phenylalanyl-tRNA synthetase beta chain
LEPIGFGAVPGGPGLLEVTVPTFRPDTTREIDVIEEVARHHGYARLPRRRPASPQTGGLSPYQRDRRLVRSAMAGAGLDEAWTPALLAPGDHARAGWDGDELTLANPLTPEDTVLRRTMLPGLLKAVAFNADRRQEEVRLFEIGHVFPVPDGVRLSAALARKGTVVDEREVLAVALAGPGDDARSAVAVWEVLAQAAGVTGVELVVDTAAPGLHPSRTCRLVADGIDVGVVGEVDPAVLEAFGLDAGRRRVGWLEVDLGILLTEAPRLSPLVRPVSSFPSSDVDLAFAVDDGVPAAAVEASLVAAAGDILESVALFDVYRGAGLEPGERSLTFRLRFCAPDRTLTRDEVAVVRSRAIEAVEQAHGARLRA